VFDEEFAGQVTQTGKIEEGRILQNFFAKTGQPLRPDWLIEMAKRVARRLPFQLGMRMGLAFLMRPRTRGWDGAKRAIEEYVDEQHAKQRRALGLGELIEAAKGELAGAGKGH
jgi:heterodisulfide reductase subunit C